MATLTKHTHKQPRFMLSLKKGRVFYTCRGCKHQCYHPEPMMKHLQVCHAFYPLRIVERERVYNPCCMLTRMDRN